MSGKVRISCLRRAGQSIREIMKSLASLKVTKSTVAIERFNNTGSVEKRPIPGHTRSARAKNLIGATRKKIFWNKRWSIRKMAIEATVSREPKPRVVRDDLKMKPCKLQKRHFPTGPKTEKRSVRTRQLKKSLTARTLRSVISTDEKIFTVEATHNRHNDHVIARNLSLIPMSEKTSQE